jgi:hypothetical protein
VFFQVTHHRQFAAIEGGIANPSQAFIGFNFERDKIAARAANDDAGSSDFHGVGIE